jgi:hypothetical protein
MEIRTAALCGFRISWLWEDFAPVTRELDVRADKISYYNLHTEVVAALAATIRNLVKSGSHSLERAHYIM